MNADNNAIVTGVSLGMSVMLFLVNIVQKIRINNLQQELDNYLKLSPLGEQFVGFSIKRVGEDRKLQRGIIESYIVPEDGEHGYDWWVEYDDGFCETMNLEEILTFLDI